MRTGFITNALILSLLPTLLTYPCRQAHSQTFDLTRMRPIVEDKTVPAAERIALGIEYLKQELSSPSHATWGVAGGPIDSGYIQSVIIGDWAVPSAQDPNALRKQHDEATDKRMKDLLALPLAQLGARDMLPTVLRLARTDPEGAIRQEALLALHVYLQPSEPTDVPPQVLAPHPWYPLDAKTRQAVTDILVAALQDPFTRYRGIKRTPEGEYFPVQDQAEQGFHLMGLTVVRRSKTMTIENANGQILRSLPLPKHYKAKPRTTGGVGNSF